MNWKPITAEAVKAAEALGHKLEPFRKRHGRSLIKMASCEKCMGCCWIAYQEGKGFGAGGRILKYECGTKEAAGLL